MPAKQSGPDAYLAKLDASKRAALEKVRKAIRVAAPQAEEGMSYGMPAFIQGRPIAGYNASASHCAYYPMSGSVIASLGDALAGYETSKGAIRFPASKPLPAALIKKLVRARLAEIDAAAPKKATSKKAKTASAAGDVGTLLRDLKHPLKKEIEAVRLIMLAASPAVSEAVKWNAPSFRTEKEFFATMNLRAKNEVQLIFHLGAKARADQKALKVADPKGLMKWLGKDRALVSLGAGADIPANRRALEAIVRAWIKYV